ncbi:MAG: oxidase [Planctomycetota bacterium]|nr:MAG: oxidase [Planctomycetota bacterium]
MEHAHAPVSVKLYAVIGTILVVGTVLAFVFADALHLSWGATVLMIFGIASFKVLLVALYFMHLKFEGRWKYILTIPPLILFLGLLLALLPDIAGLGRYG